VATQPANGVKKFHMKKLRERAQSDALAVCDF
jgi:hypothetical protein